MNTSAQKIHFIGIGGIGVSALARMFLAQGKQVSGSDVSPSRITAELQALGAVISWGHHPENLPADTDLVIATIAASSANPEIALARERGIPVLSYPEALGQMTKQYKTIAVSGTHGKTTTTAMIAKVLEDAGVDPTVVVGSLISQSGTNFRQGGGEYMVVEACEYRRSFLNLFPKLLVITNIDVDHLDYYKDLDDILLAFRQMVGKLGPEDYLIGDLSDERVASVAFSVPCHLIDYSAYFSEKFTLKVPGEHNIHNASAALATAVALEIEKDSAIQSLNDFSGTWRRFEYKGQHKKGFFIYDDYAHHPTEISATLAAARQHFSGRKITVVFQPHLFSRTKTFLDQIASSLSQADEIILAPIYAAREADPGDITSTDLAEKIKELNPSVSALESFEEIEKYAQDRMQDGEVLITMGAGDILKVGENLLKNE